jgi:phosphatidylinositol kinase/protein kinase (PI-3  family)
MGTEGNFRKFSEIAVRMMRKEKELLLTALKPFLHDPCCEWTKDRENRSSKERDADRDGNKMAKERIEIVERKLKGFPRSANHNKHLTVLNAYSVEAQVDILIEEATSIYNLSQMYFGWSPHI